MDFFDNPKTKNLLFRTFSSRTFPLFQWKKTRKNQRPRGKKRTKKVNKEKGRKETLFSLSQDRSDPNVKWDFQKMK